MHSDKSINRVKLLEILNNYCSKSLHYKVTNSLTTEKVIKRYFDDVLTDINRLIITYTIIDGRQIDNFFRYTYHDAVKIIDIAGNTYKTYHIVYNYDVIRACDELERLHNDMIQYAIDTTKVINQRIIDNKQNFNQLDAKIRRIKFLSPIKNELRTKLCILKNGRYYVNITYQHFSFDIAIDLYNDDILSAKVLKYIKAEFVRALVYYVNKMAADKSQVAVPLQKIIVYLIKHHMLYANRTECNNIKAALSKNILQEIHAYEMLCELKE